jgi:hypothetical protein
MSSTTMPAITQKSETFFERHIWKVLLGVSLIIGFFGVGDMLGGAADLQNDETIMTHSLADMSWNELQAANPNAANLIDLKFRTDGAALFIIALLSTAIGLTGFRRGQRWAWVALWALPAWLALTVFFIFNAVEHPRYGTPVPVISGSVLFAVCATFLALSYRKFFRKQ